MLQICWNFTFCRGYVWSCLGTNIIWLGSGKDHVFASNTKQKKQKCPSISSKTYPASIPKIWLDTSQRLFNKHPVCRQRQGWQCPSVSVKIPVLFFHQKYVWKCPDILLKNTWFCCKKKKTQLTKAQRLVKSTQYCCHKHNWKWHGVLLKMCSLLQKCVSKCLDVLLKDTHCVAKNLMKMS